ncbi:MAG: alpha/beta-hydrolase family protein [Thermoleophilia bacterium]|nr:alpha/beta-hydrolase family protein [Thermoleophilia bacterium]
MTASIAPLLRAAGPALERALAVGALAAHLSRDASLVPREENDQVLITAGSAAIGAATGFGADLVLARLGRRVPGGRVGASALLGGAGASGWVWASEVEERRPLVNAAETACAVAMAAAGVGEAGRLALSALPAPVRAAFASRSAAFLAAAVPALRALRGRMAEPADRVKASLSYEYLPTVSGGHGSLAPLSTLDREGRKFLGLAVPEGEIAEVMGPPVRSPIRVYVGVETAPSPVARVELAVAELERLGAFERRRILVACPSGAGFVTPVPVEVEEYMTRGDLASVAVQYNNQRSHRSLDRVPVGTETTRLLLRALRRRIDELPPDTRPELVTYGESMGAWIAAEVVTEDGLGTIDELGVAHAFLIGVPYQARQKLRQLVGDVSALPPSIGVFETSEDVVTLSEPQRARLAYALLTHPEDPVANFSGLRLVVERPTWLTKGARRHPRVPRSMRWVPAITYLQVLFDVKNGTSFTADFEAYAHDYRAGLPAALRIVFGHCVDVSPEQLARIEECTAASARAQAAREAAARQRPPLPSAGYPASRRRRPARLGLRRSSGGSGRGR